MSGRAASGRGSGVDFVAVSEEFAGQRVDNFLLARLKRVPRSRVYRLIRKGEVRVNKKRVRPVYRLQAGDVVRVPPVATAPAGLLAVSSEHLRSLRRTILLEDDRLLILDKPAGIAVHGGSGIASGIIERVRALGPEYRHTELAHRLDRETSGCLILAKRRSALRELHRAFREAEVHKRYLTLVRGAWPAGQVRVASPLRRRELGGERMVTVHPEGAPAVTQFGILQRFDHCTLLEARPETGRTHQIRVHAASSNGPVAGDEKYGDRVFNGQMRRCGLQRLFLHAAEVRLRHPVSGDWLVVEAALPEPLRSVLHRLTAAARPADQGSTLKEQQHDD